MTTPRNARQSATGRKYEWTANGRTEIYDSVTTILSRVIAKPAITAWATRTCAEYVRDNMGMLYAVWQENPEDVVSLVKRAPWEQRDAAADRGSLVHAVAEARALGQEPTVPDKLEGYVSAWSQWASDFNVTFLASEVTVYSRRLGYAGTLDAIVETPSLGKIIVDYKTGKAIYPDVAKQLTAYRWADFIGLPDGTEEPMPEVAGTFAVRLGNDGGYEMVPVRSDGVQRDLWEAIVALYRDAERSDLLGVPLMPTARLL